MNASWSKAARGYELKITSRSQPTIVQLDGFALEDQDKIGKIFKNWYGRPFEVKEHSLRGYNWGKLELKDNEMSFNVHNRPAFEIPYTEVMNTNLTGKNEVAIELSLEESSVAPPVQDENGVNGDAPHIEKRGKKAAAGIDQLVEMRFYVPGTTQRDKESDDEEDVIDEDGKVEEDAATIFYNTLLKKAEIGEVAGNTIASFNDVLHLTPRGRFEVDMYETSFRLRGKTYDYKVDYDSVKKFMLLPKADEVHMLVTIGLDPPLRQGQTRYPFLVMQYKRDEEMELEINLSEEVLEKQYKGSLHKRYEAPIASIFASVFRALTGRKMISPSKEYSSVHNQSCLKCSIKANEGFLYILDRSFIFIPKPATYIAFDTIANVTFSRVGGALAASRTFDVAIKLKDGRGEHQFSNVNREEQNALEDFLKRKGIKVKNEMMEDVVRALYIYFCVLLFMLSFYQFVEHLTDFYNSTLAWQRRLPTIVGVRTRLLAWIGVRQTKMTRVSMMISRVIATRMLRRSLTVSMPVVVVMMTIWKWMRRRLSELNRRRRSRRLLRSRLRKRRAWLRDRRSRRSRIPCSCVGGWLDRQRLATRQTLLSDKIRERRIARSQNMQTMISLLFTNG